MVILNPLFMLTVYTFVFRYLKPDGRLVEMKQNTICNIICQFMIVHGFLVR